MRHSRPRLALGLSVLTAATIALTGCSAAADATTDAEMTTVTDETGEVSVPVAPKAAIGFYSTDVDMLATLGIPLNGTQPVRGANGYDAFPAYFPDEVKSVETFGNFPEYNFEALLAARPDFILNGLGYDTDAAAKLQTIAPTYTYNGFDGSDWRDKFKEAATQLGREKQYQAWADTYQAKVDEVKAELAARGIDPVVAPVSYDPAEGMVNTSCYGTPCLVLADLGLRISPLAEGEEGTTLSLEQLDQLAGIDIAFTSVVVNEAEQAAADQGLADLKAANSAWAALPFIANDQYFGYDLEMIYGSPSGQYALLETIEQALLG
ncbi:ABC transporter substrate-binding protein [Agromyces sp. NPDC056965]|uniref:ABC transporter substrate-binding protein n=1 Tax=Agromyces sp. NPDC056965 TaxID=3345983 RepID=UPI00363727B2